MGLKTKAGREIIRVTRKLVQGYYKARQKKFTQAKKDFDVNDIQILQILEAIEKGWDKLDTLPHDYFIAAAKSIGLSEQVGNGVYKVIEFVFF